MDKSVAVSLLLTIMLTGCGGSSSTDSSPIDDPSGTPQNQNGVNGNLAGSIAAGYSSNVVTKQDLYTGASTVLPFDVITKTIANDPDLEFADTSNHIMASDGTANAAFVQTYTNCIYVDTYGFYIGNVCYTVYGSDLSPISTRRLNDIKLDGPLKLSRSQKYILANDYDRVYWQQAEDKSIHVSILDMISGEPIVTIPIRAAIELITDERLGSASVEWGVNDEVIYTDARDQPPVLYITKPLSAEIAKRITLPSQYRGLIERMHLSPDGTKLLLQYSRDTGSQAGRFPLILDLNTLEVRVPAVHAIDADNIPVGDQSGAGTLLTQGWSPDGRSILLLSARIRQNNQPILITIVDYELVSVPSDGVNQIVSGDQSIAAPGVVWIKSQNSSGESVAVRGGGGLRFNWFEGH